MLTDPVADMLTRIRNANKAMHDTAQMPTSRMKEQIARLLKEEGYIKDFRTERRAGGRRLRPLGRRPKVRPQPRARLPRPQADPQAGPAHLRPPGPPPARPRRHGHLDSVHLERRDHKPYRSREGRRRRSDLLCLVK